MRSGVGWLLSDFDLAQSIYLLLISFIIVSSILKRLLRTQTE